MKLFLIFIMCVSFVFADSEHHYNRDLTYLNLSNLQKTKIVKIIKNYRRDIKHYREEKEKITKFNQKNFIKDNFDEAKILDKNSNINLKEAKIETIFLKNMHKILSLKQRKKFAKYMEDWNLE
ncbi:MAG: hypothetical protein GXP61_07695 [Epsilonproteobacteria bacterium]|nr:hypothetical protein [Campylobacterota bacterium]